MTIHTTPSFSRSGGASMNPETERAAAAGAPDNATTYYASVLATLEKLSTEHALTDEAELSKRKAQWVDAYEHTPHGMPVELSAADHH